MTKAACDSDTARWRAEKCLRSLMATCRRPTTPALMGPSGSAVAASTSPPRARRGVLCLGLRVWILAIWLFLGGVALPAQTAVTKEYAVKAAFLFNFAQFVEWPPETFPEKETPLVIGVLGEDPFKGFLREMLRDDKAGNRPFRVEYYRRVEEIKQCHILFISNSESKRLDQILPKLKNRSVLTVGESDGFATNGGMIRFVTEGTKIRFRINNDAANAANLTISSKLLRLAEIVTSPKE